ncbi:transporter [Flaviflexus salsibiostraticola]|uniref:Transporter n=1 Tax=Flaviflexus salsibiostraticola TaxID=1282737 RepID=A0A3Q8WT98_9ACTO|nr:TrkA C-terminal domain-containing protein [Flaviflexus salsibiostraticola]AZN29627.1 transporter [Flaviflexus salsibiostraticola]
MVDLLSASPLLTIFIVVALGAALGAVPFGPLRLGAAGALFVGLFIGALVPDIGAALGLLQSLGLALFVYMVGLSAGQTFFSDLRRQAPIMAWAAIILLLSAAGAIVLGRVLNLDADMVTGIFAGSLTSTPALAAANDVTSSGLPSVGYAIGYPVGVILAILVVAWTVGKDWPSRNDTGSLAGQDIEAVSVAIKNPMPVRAVKGFAEQELRMSYLRREGRTRVISPGEELVAGDEVLFVGTAPVVAAAVDQVGERIPEHLAHDRGQVDFRHFVVSNDVLAGRTVAELNLAARFGGVVTRVSRGDLEMLARDDLTLELGDRALAVVPRESFDEVAAFFGDSVKGVSSFSALSVGVGMALGLLVGMVEIALPGDARFSLGAAAGPLVVGMVLGALHRTGPLVWQVPQAANLTIRQLGLLIFLAAVGITAGPAFMETAFTGQGALSVIIAAAVVLIAAVGMAAAGRLSGLSAPRTAGAIAGMIGQPAILSYATGRRDDERIESGYAALFALSIIVKILLVNAILAF